MWNFPTMTHIFQTCITYVCATLLTMYMCKCVSVRLLEGCHDEVRLLIINPLLCLPWIKFCQFNRVRSEYYLVCEMQIACTHFNNSLFLSQLKYEVPKCSSKLKASFTFSEDASRSCQWQLSLPPRTEIELFYKEFKM